MDARSHIPTTTASILTPVAFQEIVDILIVDSLASPSSVASQLEVRVIVCTQQTRMLHQKSAL
jgi:hypothetical protein